MDSFMIQERHRPRSYLSKTHPKKTMQKESDYFMASISVAYLLYIYLRCALMRVTKHQNIRYCDDWTYHTSSLKSLSRGGEVMSHCVAVLFVWGNLSHLKGLNSSLYIENWQGLAWFEWMYLPREDFLSITVGCWDLPCGCWTWTWMFTRGGGY